MEQQPAVGIKANLSTRRIQREEMRVLPQHKGTQHSAMHTQPVLLYALQSVLNGFGLLPAHTGGHLPPPPFRVNSCSMLHPCPPFRVKRGSLELKSVVCHTPLPPFRVPALPRRVTVDVRVLHDQFLVDFFRILILRNLHVRACYTPAQVHAGEYGARRATRT